MSNKYPITYSDNKKFLAVILFHNDEHLVEEQVNYMINNNHDIIIFNHNSNDKTQDIIDDLSKKHSKIIKKTYILDSSISFTDNGVFTHISKILQEQYTNKYDWISFIESDEFLEGPKRNKTYYEYLLDVSKTEYTYIQFDNILFWPTKDMVIHKSFKRHYQ